MCTHSPFTVHTLYSVGAQGVSALCTCPKGSLIHRARSRTVQSAVHTTHAWEVHTHTGQEKGPVRTYVNTPVHILAVYTVSIQNEHGKNTCIHTQQHPQPCRAGPGSGAQRGREPLGSSLETS